MMQLLCFCSCVGREVVPTIDVNGLKHARNEGLERIGKFSPTLLVAVGLDGLLELIDSHLAIL